MTDDIIRQREELSMQIKALKDMKVMAQSYGYDISQPAKTAKRLFSGCTSDICPQLRPRTVLQ